MEFAVEPAPALNRGLTLIRRLAEQGPASLEALAHGTGWPKSSVLRLLRSLEIASAVRRDPVTRRYHPRLQLVPIESPQRSLSERAGPTMDTLSETTAATIELYRWVDGRLTMVDRREPRDAVVCVRARVGDVRDLSELEALAQVVRVWAMDGGPRSWSGWNRSLWYWSDGKKRRLSAARRDTVLAEAGKRRVGVDLSINLHGVRRYAVPLFDRPEPHSDADEALGVLAIAQACSPADLKPNPAFIDALKQATPRFALA
ncbi:MAG: helix-turn-helix domain-containing protein [Planctomycetota bacterium]